MKRHFGILDDNGNGNVPAQAAPHFNRVIPLRVGAGCVCGLALHRVQRNAVSLR